MTWLTVALGVLTVAALIRVFWQANAGPVSIRQAGLAGALVLALLFSIRVSPVRWGAPRIRSVAAPATTAEATTVPVSVQGASLTREEAVRLDSCESALAAIAQALDRAVADGASVTVPGSPAESASNPGRRLTSCEVRLKAIAATLPAGTAGG